MQLYRLRLHSNPCDYLYIHVSQLVHKWVDLLSVSVYTWLLHALCTCSSPWNHSTYHKDVCCVWKLPSSSEQLLKIIELVREETVYHRMIKTQATWSKTMHDIQSYWVLQYQLWSSTQWRKKQCITDTSNLNCNTVVMYFSLSPCQSDANTFSCYC